MNVADDGKEMSLMGSERFQKIFYSTKELFEWIKNKLSNS